MMEEHQPNPARFTPMDEGKAIGSATRTSSSSIFRSTEGEALTALVEQAVTRLRARGEHLKRSHDEYERRPWGGHIRANVLYDLRFFSERFLADADKLDALLTARASSAPTTEPDSDYEPHTGDDDLLDALTGIRAGVESLSDPDADDADRDEVIANVLEELTTADGLRVAELKARASSAPPPVSPDSQTTVSRASEQHTASGPTGSPRIPTKGSER
jgi:hypothetical protein